MTIRVLSLFNSIYFPIILKIGLVLLGYNQKVFMYSTSATLSLLLFILLNFPLHFIHQRWTIHKMACFILHRLPYKLHSKIQFSCHSNGRWCYFILFFSYPLSIVQCFSFFVCVGEKKQIENLFDGVSALNGKFEYSCGTKELKFEVSWTLIEFDKQ